MDKNAQTTVLSAQAAGFGSYLRELWHYRQLTLLLARRDLKAKYAQSVLGILWAMLQPLTDDPAVMQGLRDLVSATLG